MDREVATGFGDMEVTGDLEKNRNGATVGMEIGGEEWWKRTDDCSQPVLLRNFPGVARKQGSRGPLRQVCYVSGSSCRRKVSLDAGAEN